MFAYDDSVLISLKELRLLGLLSEEQHNRAEVVIKRSNGLSVVRNSLLVEVSTKYCNSYLKLDFVVDGKQFSQKFKIVKKRNGLPKGFAWFVICPITNTNCTKLYLCGTTFKSKRSIDAGAYRIQLIKFGKKRELFKKLDRINKDTRSLHAMKRKYSKPYYSGRITKRNMKAIEASWRLNRIASLI